MKKVIIPTVKSSTEIDWNVPQWVINKGNSGVVLTTGIHKENNFEGICMPCKDYPNGNLSQSWNKHAFNRLDFDIPFVISND